jgi:protein-S-isoprenylcysteine O-methyltransferase Ste14
VLYDDQIFRLILIVGFCSVCPIALYHRLKSQASGERLDRSQEGIFILATLRPLGLASMAGLVAFMIDPDWMRWSQVGLPAWARWGGVGIGACTGALLIWVFDSLGKNITDTVVTRRDHTLVTTGPYRWVRHPFYLAGGAAIVANSLVTATGESGSWSLNTGPISPGQGTIAPISPWRKSLERWQKQRRIR